MTEEDAWLLHDKLRYALEDPDGHFHNEREFTLTFETFIDEVIRGRTGS